MIFDEVKKFPLKMADLAKINEMRQQGQEEEKILKDPIMTVSYKEGIFKGAQFLNFAGSQNIPLDLLEEDLTYEEKADLLFLYMTIHKKVHIPVLNEIVGVMLVENRGLELVLDESDDYLFMDKEERDRFFKDNKDVFDRWYLFLDSTLINMPFCLNGYMETQGSGVMDHFGVIEDLSYIGLNVSSLFGVEDYIEAYVSVIPEGSEVKVFKSHLFEPVFGGFSLSDLYTNGRNTLFPLLASMYGQWFTEEEIEKVRDSGPDNKTD